MTAPARDDEAFPFTPIPLRANGRPQVGFNDRDYEPTIELRAERHGLIYDEWHVGIDHDPKNNPDVYADCREWGYEPDDGTLGQNTPSIKDGVKYEAGRHNVYHLRECPHLVGKIKQKEHATIRGVDIKPGMKGYLKTGDGYSWRAGDIKPLPQVWVRYFENEDQPGADAERPGSRNPAVPSPTPASGLVTPRMYMDAVEPVQAYDGWRMQCDSLMAGGATLEEVLAWCSRGAKHDPVQDRSIIEGSLRKGLTITSGWYATDYYRRAGKDVPRTNVTDNGQWRSSELHNRRRRMELTVNEGDAFTWLMRFGRTVDEIAAVKGVPVRSVKRWLRNYCTNSFGRNAPLTSYVISVAKKGTAVLAAGRWFRLGRSIRWVAVRLGITEKESRTLHDHWKKCPLLGHPPKKVLRDAGRDELAARRREKAEAKRKAERQAKAEKPAQRRVKALIDEASGHYDYDERRYVVDTKEQRWVYGLYDGDKLWIEGEITPTGKPKWTRKVLDHVDAPVPKATLATSIGGTDSCRANAVDERKGHIAGGEPKGLDDLGRGFIVQLGSTIQRSMNQ